MAQEQINTQLSNFQGNADLSAILWADMPADPFTINDVEQVLKQFPQTEEMVAHHFGGGVYARELFIPAGNLIVGKRHRHESLNMVIKGHISVFVAPGLPVKHLYAPAIFPSPPFSKKLGYAHEDTVFVNVHPTMETDLEKIEAEFIIPEEEYEELGRIEMKSEKANQEMAKELDMFFKRNEGNRLSMEMIQGLALNLESILRGNQEESPASETEEQ